MTDHATHTVAITHLLTRFFQSSDDKNWSVMRDCLCDEVFTDYSAFRGVPASTIAADSFVEQRRMALETLDTQHTCLNLRVEWHAFADTATARCDYVIYRFHTSFGGINDQYFNSTGHYFFAFTNVGGAWKIARITQYLLRNQSNRERAMSDRAFI